MGVYEGIMKIYQRLDDSFTKQEISVPFWEVAAIHISPSLNVTTGNTPSQILSTQMMRRMLFSQMQHIGTPL